MLSMLAQYPHFFSPRFLVQSLVSALLLCLTGLTFLTAAAQSSGLSRGRVAYAKCARQLGHLACLLGILSAVALLAAHCAALTDVRELADLLTGIDLRGHFTISLKYGSVLCVLLSTLFIFLYTNLERKLREHSLLRQLPVLSAGMSACAALYLDLLVKYERTARLPGSVVQDALWERLFPDSGVFWGVAGSLPFAALALAGGYGALWLLARRDRDDYGRDHYNLVLPWCALWARNSWCAFWLLCAARFVFFFFEQSALARGEASAMFAPGLILLGVFSAPGFWWLGISRSANPLRAKIALGLAPVAATVFIASIYAGLG